MRQPSYDPSKWPFIRECQECGYQQFATEPKPSTNLAAYGYHKCRKCKSEALDYGSKRPYTEEQKAELKTYQAWEDSQ